MLPQVEGAFCVFKRSFKEDARSSFVCQFVDGLFHCGNFCWGRCGRICWGCIIMAGVGVAVHSPRIPKRGVGLCLARTELGRTSKGRDGSLEDAQKLLAVEFEAERLPQRGILGGRRRHRPKMFLQHLELAVAQEIGPR